MTTMSCGMQNAERILTETVGGRVTPHDILPESDNLLLSEIPVTTWFQKYGPTYHQYLECVLNMEKIRNACVLASRKCANLSHPVAATTWASYQMGSNGAGELTSQVWIKALEEKIPAVRILARSDTEYYEHEFVIYGTTSDEFHEKARQHDGRNLLKIMDGLKTGIVIDPYLKVAYPITEFGISETARYCREAGVYRCVGVVDHPTGEDQHKAENLRKLKEEMERVATIARGILDLPENTNDKIVKVQGILADPKFKN